MATPIPYGIIDQTALGRKNDYLYRLSIKGLILDQNGHVLVVKESGRTWWDLPGGGMDHGEDITSAIARELDEEVGLSGSFTHQIIAVDDPAYLGGANILQVRLVFRVFPENMEFQPGVDADEIAFVDPEVFKNADNPVEKRVYLYVQKCKHFNKREDDV